MWMETHWFAPCCAAAVVTLPPEANRAYPPFAILFRVLEPPRPVDVMRTRDEFQFMSSATAMKTSILRTTGAVKVAVRLAWRELNVQTVDAV